MTTDRTFSRAWRFRWGHVDAYLAEQAARAAPALVLLKDEWDDFGLIGSASWHANKEAHAALNRAAPAQQYACHIDTDDVQKPDACVLDGGNWNDCYYARKHGETARDHCGEWKPIKIAPAQPSKEWLDEAMRLADQYALRTAEDFRDDSYKAGGFQDQARAALREHLEAAK